MSDRSRSASKKTPTYLTYSDAIAKFGVQAEAWRRLCAVLLDGDDLSPRRRAEVLALQAIIDGVSDDDGS